MDLCLFIGLDLFLSASVRSRIEYATQFELYSFKFKQLLGALSGLNYNT
jgi:hypothetical protein